MSRIYPYAGFWRRAIALMIDSIIISIPCTIVYAIIMAILALRLGSLPQANQANPQEAFLFAGSMLLSQLIFVVVFWLYFTLLESGQKQATVGKRVMGIKVVGADGGRITFARATGRFFGKCVSYMLLNFGYYMAGFTKKRQALHDLMADTYVVREDFQPGQDKPALEFSAGGLIASIFMTILPILFFFMGIFFALLIPAMLNQEKTELQLTATQAKAQMLLFSMKTDEKPNLPKTEDGIYYSKTRKGYRAEFTDKEGHRVVLLNQEGKYDACCAEGDCELVDEERCD